MLTTQQTTRPQLLDYIYNRHRGTTRSYVDVANLARSYSPFLSRLNFMKSLPVHNGCVNTICWNKTGEYILSGSDDCNFCITKPACMFDTTKDYTVLHKVETRHSGKIFAARFLPNSNDSLIVSASSNGSVMVNDINLTDPTREVFNFSCHTSIVYEVATIPEDDRVYFTCSDDKTIRLFDLRCHRCCFRSSTCPHPPLIRNSHAMTTLDVHPLNSNLLLVGRADGLGLVYDRRKLPNPSDFSRERAHIDRLTGNNSSSYNFKYLHPLEGVVSQFTVPDMEEKCRFTTLCYSPNGQQVLASYSQDYIYLFDHDKSSNFQLVQTLPQNIDSVNDNGSNSINLNNENNSETGTSSGSSNEEPPLRRSLRTPNIRIRGDWSDTGINSVPITTRSNQQSNQSTTNQQPSRSNMSELAFTLGNRGGLHRFVSLTELITGDLRTARSSRPQSESSNSNVPQDETVVLIEANPIGPDTDDDDDDDEDEDGRDNDHEMEVEDLDPNETVRLHVNLDFDDDQESDQEYSTTTRTECDKNNQKDKKPEVSSKSKQKFKESLSDLKNKFSNIPKHHPRVKYQGHRNCKTSIKKAIFWGDNYIMSGSDCGRIVVWEKESAKLIMAFQADERVVNCLAPNPHHYVLASSGIDYDVKLWSTQNIMDCPLQLSQSELEQIIKNNELMLEEAKHTLVVPPHLFFRVLASFAHNRLS